MLYFVSLVIFSLILSKLTGNRHLNDSILAEGKVLYIPLIHYFPLLREVKYFRE